MVSGAPFTIKIKLPFSGAQPLAGRVVGGL